MLALAKRTKKVVEAEGVAVEAERRVGVVGGADEQLPASGPMMDDSDAVAVVGDDFSEEDQSIFQGRNINLDGLERVPGGDPWPGAHRRAAASAGMPCARPQVSERASAATAARPATGARRIRRRGPRNRRASG